MMTSNFHEMTYGNNVNIFVVSGPSGAGKTVICKETVARTEGLVPSVSATTRSMRPGEVDGKDYHFFTKEVFSKGINEGEFIEWASIHDNLYGTPKSNIYNAVNKKNSLILEIDPQGAHQIRKNFPEAVLVFIAPPSLAVLEERLKNRKSDTTCSIKTRLSNAPKELSEIPFYDYLIINDSIEESVKNLQAIVSARKCLIKKEEVNNGS